MLPIKAHRTSILTLIPPTLRPGAHGSVLESCEALFVSGIAELEKSSDKERKKAGLEFKRLLEHISAEKDKTMRAFEVLEFEFEFEFELNSNKFRI